MKLLLFIALVLSVKGVPFTPLELEQMPELNIPRQAHSLHCVNGEYTVIGGHTTGFVPTATAEYYRGGKWHTVTTLYSHDAGFATRLSNDEVLLGGGYSEAFGIGQTWGVELYHPTTHSFTYLPILNHKRTHATAMEMTDGSILVCGNWYSRDALERYTPGGLFEQVKEVSCPRDLPFVLQVSADNAYVFGSADNFGEPLETGWVDQLNGEQFQEPLLQEWTTENLHLPNPPEHYRIGEFSYLLPVWKDGELALLQLSEGRFSLLETANPIPMESPWCAIEWESGLQVESESATAWKHGRDSDGRAYLLRISYEEVPAGIEVYYTEPIADLPYKMESLALPGGRFLMAGGVIKDSYDSQGMVIMLHTKPMHAKTGAWFWWIGGVLILAGCMLVLRLRLRRRAEERVNPSPKRDVPDLRERIVREMETGQLFRNPDFRIGDLASRLNTNSTYVSACLNMLMNTSFPKFITGYRIRYAMEQMKANPDKFLSDIAVESGFSNENTFFRSFKAETGLTPSEWRKRNN